MRQMTQKEEQKDTGSGDGVLKADDKGKARAGHHKHKDASKDTAEHKDKKKAKKSAKETKEDDDGLVPA